MNFYELLLFFKKGTLLRSGATPQQAPKPPGSRFAPLGGVGAELVSCWPWGLMGAGSLKRCGEEESGGVAGACGIWYICIHIYIYIDG